MEVNDIVISPMWSKEDQGAGFDYDYDTNNRDAGSQRVFDDDAAASLGPPQKHMMAIVTI